MTNEINPGQNSSPESNYSNRYTQNQSEITTNAHPYQSAQQNSDPYASSNSYYTVAPVPAPQAVNTKNSSGKTFLISFAGALVACALAFGLMFGLNPITTGSTSVKLGATSSNNISAPSEDASLAETVADLCLPSVASITVYGTQTNTGNSIFGIPFGYGYGQNNSSELTEIGLGSGVMLSSDGYLITNYHVIADGQKYKVIVEGEEYDATLVGSDSSSDVAVLKISDGKTFKAIELGDSDNIKIGEWVMTIGSPFGLEQSVATGIVSATSRSQIVDAGTDMYGNSTGESTIYPNMIQTDAAINPGNSGGALVNSKGQLIGINTLISSYSGNYSGVGFAIPSNYAINLAQDIIAGKEPTHAQLGITMTTINDSIAKRYGFAANSGAYVSSVAEGSAAKEAGIKEGDIITAFNGEKVSSASDLMLDVRGKNPGDKVKLTVNRDGEVKEIEVTLGKSQAVSTSNSSQQNQNNNSNSGNMFNFNKQNNTY